MGKLKDLTGQRFGYWTVLEIVRDAKKIKWRCKCDCGVEKIQLASNLISGASTSCGCKNLKKKRLI